MKVELYLNSEKSIEEGEIPYFEKSGGACATSRRLGTDSDVSCHRIKRAFIGFTDKEKKIMNMLEQIAAQHNLELRIYDVSKTIHAFRAWRKRVRDLPTILIGKHKFTEGFDKEEILRIVEALK